MHEEVSSDVVKQLSSFITSNPNVFKEYEEEPKKIRSDVMEERINEFLHYLKYALRHNLIDEETYERLAADAQEYFSERLPDIGERV